MKLPFGKLVPGTPFRFGGAYYVKTVPNSKFNSLELGTKDHIEGAFFDHVEVEVDPGLLPVPEPRPDIVEKSREDVANGRYLTSEEYKDQLRS